MRRNNDSIAKQALQWTSQGHRNTGDQTTRGKEISNGHGRFQVQLEEDGVGSTEQSWMETSSLWPTLHQEQQRLSQAASLTP